MASAVKLRPSEAGRDNPIFDLGTAGTLGELLERLPALDHASVTLGEKPLAVVLANAARDGGPVLVAYQRYGQGKALSLNASGMWRWAFRESAGRERSSVSAVLDFPAAMAAGGKRVSAGLGCRTNHGSALLQQRTADAVPDFHTESGRTIYQPRLVITGPGATNEVEPRARGDVFVAEAGPFVPGTYRVTLKNNVGKPAELSQSIEVVSASLEKRELSADPEMMRKLAGISGGAVVGKNDIARMPEIVKRWEEARQLSHRRQWVWDSWWILAGLVGVLGGEWWLRRQEGLL